MVLNPNDVAGLLMVTFAAALFIGTGAGFVLGYWLKWFRNK